MGRGDRRQERAWRAGRGAVEGSARLLAALVRTHGRPPADAPEQDGGPPPVANGVEGGTAHAR
ncbi:hypothetical protein [Xanthobacter autotrophicus]|uniref:hypothetical protein n=1 Tax=Xanthobacter autotrophicus TaxID=280 RepID=UPI003729D6DC